MASEQPTKPLKGRANNSGSAGGPLGGAATGKVADMGQGLGNGLAPVARRCGLVFTAGVGPTLKG